MFEINSLLSQKEFINSNLALLFKKKNTKILLGFLFLFAIVYGILCSTNPEYSKNILLSPIILILAIPIFTILKARSVYNQNNLSNFNILYKFSSKNIFIQSRDFENTLEWNGIEKIEIDKNWVYLYLRNKSVLPLPMRCFDEKKLELMKKFSIENQKTIK